MRDFLRCGDSGEKPLATVEAGVRASLVAFAADRSVQTGVIVRMAEMYLPGI